MDAFIIFDSNFGNTKKIADYLAHQYGPGAASISVDDFNATDLEGIKLFIVGSPINAWRPTKKITGFLNGLNSNHLRGIKGAAFDTRVKSFFSGNAAKRIAKALEHCGVKVIVPPMGFYVEGNKGPLADGALKKADEWLKLIKSKI